MIDRDETRLPEEHLRSLVRGGTRASLAAQVASQLASLVILAVLYRLLRPQDYGLFGMALPAVMLPRMAATLGVGAAIVQSPNLTSGQQTSLFWLLQGLGLAAALVTAALAPLLAAIYDQPRLAPLGIALAGSTLLAALAQTHQSLLERKLAFVPLSTARIAGQLAGGSAAIIAAWRGLGVWSLVLQQVVELALTAALLWRMEPWRPAMPTHGARLGGMVAFSGYFAATNLVFYVAQNLEKLFFPWLLGPSAEVAIGLFSQALSFVLRIVYLVTAAFSGVMLPALSRAHGNPRLFAELVGRFFRMTGIALFPCGIGLFLVAPEVMLLLGGPKWRDAGVILQAFAPLLLVQGFLNLTGSIFAARGQGRRLVAGSLVYLLLLVQGLMAGWLGARYFPSSTDEGPQQAALGMAAAYTLVTIGVIFLPYLTFCLRSAEVSVRAALLPLLPALRSAAVMGAVVWIVRRLLDALSNPLDFRLALALLVAVGIASYVLLGWREVRWLAAELSAGGGVSTPESRSPPGPVSRP